MKSMIPANTRKLATAAAGVALVASTLTACGGGSSHAGGLSDLQSKLGCTSATPTSHLQVNEPHRDKRVKCGKVIVVTFTSKGQQSTYDDLTETVYGAMGGYSVLAGDGWSVMGKTAAVKHAKGKVGGTIVSSRS